MKIVQKCLNYIVSVDWWNGGRFNEVDIKK